MKRSFRAFVSLLTLAACLLGSAAAYAHDDVVAAVPADKNFRAVDEYINPDSFPENVEAVPVSDGEEFSFIQAVGKAPADRNDIASAASSVARMRIYATASDGGSSINTSGHVFLTVTNTSGSDITVGGLSIGPSSSLTIGTWGNKSEHTGLWYNLEGYLAYHQDVYSNCVSMQVSLTDNLLSTVSSNVKNGDKWSLLNNCSSFATGVWNSVCSDEISAGIPNTPANTMNSIKSYTAKYSAGLSVPYDYVVYYGNPAVKSSEFK